MSRRCFGISLLQGSPETAIGSAVVRTLGIEATFFVGSLTEQPVAESNRLLLILATNALNSGMTFENEKRLKLVSLGKAPILRHVAKAQFTLNHKQASKLKMWALSPTPYFELAVVTTP